MGKRLVIIGGVAAGMSAAAKAKRVNPDLEIKVFTEGQYISYAACGLPYFIGDKIKEVDKLFARDRDFFVKQGIEVHTGYRAEEIIPQKKEISVFSTADKKMMKVNYDRLIIATGARAFVPPMEGIFLEGVFTLRNVEDGLRIKKYILGKKPGRAVIVGGGYIGLEMAENLAELGIKVKILERSKHILPNMDIDMAELVKGYLLDKGIDVVTEVGVQKIDGDIKVEKVITEKGDIETDMVILSVGIVPNTELAARAGIELGYKNAIRVNSKQETNIPDIYAAGDCATVYHLLTGREVYVPSGPTANKQGRIAGENAAGGNEAFYGVVGTAITKVFDLEIARTGLSCRECEEIGWPYETSFIKAKNAAEFYPGNREINIKLIAHKGTGKLLGGQIVGFNGAGKKIDVIATAITLGATVQQLKNMDLAYVPPLSPVWDGLLIALNQFA